MNQSTAQYEPKAGSSLYYALRNGAADKRSDVIKVLRFCQTLASTLNDVSEPTVAEKKIHWWHEEIERLYQGKARHPDTQILTPIVQYYGFEAASWLAVVSVNNDEKFINATDEIQYLDRLRQDFNARTKLCHQVLQGADDQPMQHWADGFGQFDRLRRFHQLYNLGYPVFPDTDYSAAGIAPGDIHSEDKYEQVVALFHHRITQCLMALNMALAAPDPALRHTVLPFYTLARLRVAQLTLWQQQKLLPSVAYSTLTPLKKAWLAWRCRRQHAHLRQKQ